jgi:cellulase/cellobiase CelA1
LVAEPTVAVTAGASAWLAWVVTEPAVPSAVAVVADTTEVAAVVSGAAAWTTEPTVLVSPDVTAGTTDPLVTAFVTACRAFPAPATTVTTAEPGTVPA